MDKTNIGISKLIIKQKMFGGYDQFVASNPKTPLFANETGGENW